MVTGYELDIADIEELNALYAVKPDNPTAKAQRQESFTVHSGLLALFEKQYQSALLLSLLLYRSQLKKGNLYRLRKTGTVEVECYQIFMAETLGCKDTGISQIIAKLKKRGYVSVHKVKANNGHAKNVYIIHLDTLSKDMIAKKLSLGCLTYDDMRLKFDGIVKQLPDQPPPPFDCSPL